MPNPNELIQPKDFLVLPDKKIKLKNIPTAYKEGEVSKSEAETLLAQSREHLAEMQEKLYAHNRFRVLIILQAMDASGKDGAVKHIMSGLNPLGVRAYSFKAPNSIELDHDYFWRHNLALPGRGEIAIHNRSYYENVLVTRIHPEYILSENLPGIDSVKKIDADFWARRYEQIRNYEQNLVENGMVILKFFLHLSKDEQKKRLIDRIDDPAKNWKFSTADVKERGYWDAYQIAYEDAINNTSTEAAPWHIVPADNKWYTRLAIAELISQKMHSLKLEFPTVSEAQKAELQKAKAQLLSEK
jgi:PPK2 family polyphosphate:nucleotide phosphotransferase